jgi:predicted DNA-binding protein
MSGEKPINSSVRLPRAMYQAALAIAKRNGLTYSAWVKASIAPAIESERNQKRAAAK